MNPIAVSGETRYTGNKAEGRFADQDAYLLTWLMQSSGTDICVSNACGKLRFFGLRHAFLLRLEHLGRCYFPV
jgi:hypothetical protein